MNFINALLGFNLMKYLFDESLRNSFVFNINLMMLNYFFNCFAEKFPSKFIFSLIDVMEGQYSAQSWLLGHMMHF